MGLGDLIQGWWMGLEKSQGWDLKRINGMDCPFLNGGDLVLEK